MIGDFSGIKFVVHILGKQNIEVTHKCNVIWKLKPDHAEWSNHFAKTSGANLPTPSQLPHRDLKRVRCGQALTEGVGGKHVYFRTKNSHTLQKTGTITAVWSVCLRMNQSGASKPKIFNWWERKWLRIHSSCWMTNAFDECLGFSETILTRQKWFDWFIFCVWGCASVKSCGQRNGG